MAHTNFVIPSKHEELLSEGRDYFVSEVLVPRELLDKLKEARISLKDDGPEFILENFDVFYSIIHHQASLPIDLIFKSYQDLHKAATDLNKSLGFLLEDTSSINDEVKQKYQNVMKMLIYLYVHTVLLIEHKNVVTAKNQGLLKGRKRVATSDVAFNLDKKSILLTLNHVIQNEIAIFWDPPIVEDNFISLIAEICYKFLQNPLIKGEKDVKEEVFNLIGTLIKSYNHSTRFAIRMAQMIKDEEHLVHCLSEGIKQLVDVYSCKGIVHALIREITEWQTDEKFQDSQGSRFCAQFLTSMAVSMPNLMLPELLYLNKYLYNESATLRISVLNVITEVIIHVLTKHTLSKEDTQYRDGFLAILFDHMNDNAAHVRSKVLQQWARLQEENAIPKKLVNEVLKKIIDYYLLDKAAQVRKCAANCVTTFLAHNTYSAELSLTKMSMELERNESLLKALEPQVDQARTIRTAEMEQEWTKLVPALKKVLSEELEKKDDENSPEAEHQLDKAEATELIRMYLNAGKFKESIAVWKASTDEFENMAEDEDREQFMEEFLSHFKVIYMESLEVLEGIRSGFSRGDFVMTEDDFRKFEVLTEKVEYSREAVTFLKLIDSAIEKMVELLETTFISDMQEAVAFFISAYQFNIDNSANGVAAMLKIMKRNEQDRKDMIIEAFKTIYLKTSAPNMMQHCVTIVNRLIGLLKSVPGTNMDELEVIISEWVGKGILDNNVIDMLWQYFIKKVPVSDEDSHASVELLRMAALSRRTIITRNIKLVSSVAFGEMGQKNLAFLGSACNFLALVGRDRIDITSNDPPFKIGPEDEIFKDLFGILSKKFFTPDEFYYQALSGAIEFVYKVCGKPEELCEEFIKETVGKLADQDSIDSFVYIRLCQLMGLVALKHLDYLDEDVYKELKRRENFRSKKDTDKKKKSKRKSKGNRNLTTSAIANSSIIMDGSTLTTSAADDTNMEGAQAEDEDAEFILRVLERNTVSGSGLLGQLAPIIINICEKPDIYNDVYLQGAAVTALIRYMLVSSEFCTKHIQLLFTLFEKTKYSEIKVSILVHLSDLLTRFPNIIEPWTARIYARLRDQSVEIRRATFFTLSGLVLRDMIRTHSYIHLMVDSLIDPDRELSSMCRTFFITLAQKESSLYSVLPDIFSYLMDSQHIKEDDSRDIMKFLFELMDKSKYMDNLVDRFCLKFPCTEVIRQQRDIAYCLSLIVYNEKALKKLLEHFPLYKPLVHDSDIYAYFKTILQNASKQQVGRTDLKPIVAEIEQRISSVFEPDQNNEQVARPPRPKSARKRPAAKATRGRKGSKRQENSSDSE